jgi:hypothetical protein
VILKINALKNSTTISSAMGRADVYQLFSAKLIYLLETLSEICVRTNKGYLTKPKIQTLGTEHAVDDSLGTSAMMEQETQ